MSNKLLLIGAGGHCKSVLDSIDRYEYDEIAIIDKNLIGEKIMGIDVIGSDDDLKALFNDGYNLAFISIGNIEIRTKLYMILKEIGFEIPTIIDKSAAVSKFAKINQGVFIGKNSVVNADAHIGIASIVNTGSIVEHDCIIKDFVNIAPNVTLGGNVKIGQFANIGLSSVIRENLIIGEKSIIGMGSVVVNSIDDNILAYGNPCVEVKKL